MWSNNIYIFIGPPGSGKGALADWCVQNLLWKQLSTGNLCREHVAEGTDIGLQIDFALKSGKLISDHVVSDMVLDWFEHKVENFPAVILDGFPRTTAQADFLHSALQRLGYKGQILVIEFEIDNQVVVQRLVNRCVCSNKDCQAVYSLIPNSSFSPRNDMQCNKCKAQLIRRNDDVEDTVKKRLEIYSQHKDSLVAFYRQLVIPIKKLDARASFDTLLAEFQAVVKSCAL
jgi:adenylate kinase